MCQFMPARIQFLENIFTDLGLEAEPDKIDNIPIFPKPGNERQLHRILGMANYLTQFCIQLGSVAAPPSERQDLTKYWKCTHLHNVSFEEVRALIMSNKVLMIIHSDFNQSLYFVCHTSHTGIA